MNWKPRERLVLDAGYINRRYGGKFYRDYFKEPVNEILAEEICPTFIEFEYESSFRESSGCFLKLFAKSSSESLIKKVARLKLLFDFRPMVFSKEFSTTMFERNHLQRQREKNEVLKIAARSGFDTKPARRLQLESSEQTCSMDSVPRLRASALVEPNKIYGFGSPRHQVSLTFDSFLQLATGKVSIATQTTPRNFRRPSGVQTSFGSQCERGSVDPQNMEGVFSLKEENSSLGSACLGQSPSTKKSLLRLCDFLHASNVKNSKRYLIDDKQSTHETPKILTFSSNYFFKGESGLPEEYSERPSIPKKAEAPTKPVLKPKPSKKSLVPVIKKPLPIAKLLGLKTLKASDSKPGLLLLKPKPSALKSLKSPAASRLDSGWRSPRLGAAFS